MKPAASRSRPAPSRTPTAPDIVDKLCDAFRTGIGLSYEQLGANAAHRTERMLGPWVRQALVPQIVPALDGVQPKLERGCKVADVGCGSGLALASMAAAFPKSEFHGYDPSSHAIANCHAKVREQKLPNMQAYVASGEALPTEPTYDFVITFDCLHDMTRPAAVIESIRRALKPDGTWLIKDIRSNADFKKNMRNPMLAMFYGFSVSACMSSALSEPGGAGSGTLGLQSGRRGTDGARGGLHALHAARLRRSEQSVLRGAAVARDRHRQSFAPGGSIFG